jgi:hypothetical protein
VNFANGVPEPEKQAEIMMQWERKLSGAKNSGKFLMSFNEGKDAMPEVEAFPLSDADKQYQFLSEESTRQIMRAHRVTSPLLFGIREGGGLGSNKDEMTVALSIFTQHVIEPLQRIITDAVTVFTKVPTAIIPNIPVLDNPAQQAAPAQLSSHDPEKKKSDAPVLTDAEADAWLDRLASRGEYCDMDVWELESETEAGDMDAEIAVAERLGKSVSVQFSAEEKSKWGDRGLYKLRYRYSTNVDENTRPFCRRMVDLSVAGVMYRREDIDAMSDAGVNGQFAPTGESTYDIFKWKGGCFCHHKWVRLIFVRKRGADGKILPPSKTDDLENDKRVGSNPYVPKKGDEGVAPINTPSRGSLKYA